MSATATAAPPPPATAGRGARPGRHTAALPVVLGLAAVLISGFTYGRGLDVFDGGLLLQASSRIAESGQWPYADFYWPYGPAHALLGAASYELLGANDVWWRVLRIASDAATALLVFWLVRPVAGPRWALAAWAAAALIISQPITANPAPIAFALALGAVALAVARRPAAAGVAAGLAAAWRPDFGVVAAAAVALALLGARSPGALGRAAVAAGGVTLVAYGPFLVAAGPAGLFDALAGESAGDGAWWRLPFPVLYDGPAPAWPPRLFAERLKDLLAYELPLAAVLGLGAAVAAGALRWRRARAVPPAAAGLLVVALGSLLYELSRADELHAQPLLVSVVALAAVVAGGGGGDRDRDRARRSPRGLRIALGAVIGLVLVVGGLNRASALLLPPDLAPLDLPGTAGIRVPPAEARALERLARDVQARTRPGEPILLAPRRSDLVAETPLVLHFLLDRPNVLARDALLLARPAEQARVVDVLRRRRPLVVRWTDPRSSRREPNLRGRPSGSRALDEWLARAYVRRARIGAYDVLEPRP